MNKQKKDKIIDAVEQTLNNELVKEFPTVASGDITPTIHRKFYTALELLLNDWHINNVETEIDRLFSSFMKMLRRDHKNQLSEKEASHYSNLAVYLYMGEDLPRFLDLIDNYKRRYHADQKEDKYGVSI